MLCFYHILDEAGINAEVILKANKPEQKLIRKEFLRGLAYTLLTQWVTRRAQSTRGFKTRIVRAMSIVLGKEVKGIFLAEDISAKLSWTSLKYHQHYPSASP